MQPTSAEDLELARRAIDGDGEAFGVLFERWFDRAFDVAWHIVWDRDGAADVTQEAFAAAWQQIGSLRQPESFGGWLLRIARNKALNRRQREQRSRPVGDEETLVELDTRRSDDPTDSVTRAEHGDLVWAASAALGEDDASVLSLHLRHGLGAPELADELGVKPNAAHQRLFRLKRRLGDAIGAWVLWRHGEPSCTALQTILDDAGTTRFDAMTARIIAAHAEDCSACDASRELRLSPEALFGAMPLVVADPALRAKVVAALEQQGVPVRAPDTAGEPSGPPDSGDGATSGTETPSSDAPDLAHMDTAETHEPSELPSEIGASGELPGSRLSRKQLVAAGAGATALVVAGLAVWMLTGGSADDDLTAGPGEPGAQLIDPDITAPPATIGEADIADAPATDDVDEDLAGNGDDAGTGPAPTDPEVLAESVPADPDTTTSTESAAPPVIGGFRAAQGDHECGSTEVPITFVWSSTDATSATLGPQGGAASSVPTNGPATRCSSPGTTWVLTVTGPGGTVSAEAFVE